MEQAFKHLAVRLWTSLLVGGLTALTILPALAGALGPGLMIVPAFLLIAISFWLIGIAFATIGRRRLNRLIGEATVWERAGMAREARQALNRAEGTLDSFYFSPSSRKAPAGQLLAHLARFQLSQAHPESSSDSVVETYLRYFPDDREAAIKWLEGLLAGRPAAAKAHEIAAGIGEAHADDPAIQRMLAQFYLAEGCCDFAALKTFRRLMGGRHPLTDGLLNDLIDLFISQQRADTLALEVYVMGHQRGRADSALLEGVAACVHLVHPGPLTLPLLEKAEIVLTGIQPSVRLEMAATFLPDLSGSETPPRPPRKRMARPAIEPLLQRAWAGVGVAAERLPSTIARMGRQARRVLWSRQTKTTIKWTVMALFSLGVGWFAVSTTLNLAKDFKPPETVPEPVTAPPSDPFTLQVAAYLKEDDAKRHMAQLKKKGLDAYLTRATGNNKTWYQVRVSHFKTKEEALSMGESLRNRHMIGDYYVANYKRPEVP